MTERAGFLFVLFLVGVAFSFGLATGLALPPPCDFPASYSDAPPTAPFPSTGDPA